MGSEGLEFFLKFKKIQCALTRYDDAYLTFKKIQLPRVKQLTCYDDAYEVRVNENASHEMLTPAPTILFPSKIEMYCDTV